VIAGLDRDKDADAEPDAVLVDQRDAFDNDAVGLKPLNALPARRRRKADALPDVGDRQGRVILQNSNDFRSMVSMKAILPITQENSYL